MGYGYYPRYVSVAEKRAKAEKKIKQLRKKQPDIEPVILQGQALATTWWGKSWNRNLESYADYSNRIGRGRSYVRHMAVLDLRIGPGLVEALVQGTRATPYKVRIKIAKIKSGNWKKIAKKCQAELSSLPDLLAGKFPRSLQNVFMVQGSGLFPSPAEISFDCSCPDWASMCKHVAATLYGVGARLDEDPALFFTLRQVEMDELVTQAVQEKTESIIKNTIIRKQQSDTDRVIGDEQLSELFGLDFDTFDPDASLVPGKKKKNVTKKKGAPQRGKEKDKDGNTKLGLAAKVRHKRKTATKKRGGNQKRTARAVELPPGYGSASALVLGCIGESAAEGISVGDLAEITAIPRTKLYPILQSLKRKGQVISPVRGVYCAAEL